MTDATTYLSPQTLKKHLQELLNLDELKRSPVLSRFLEFVMFTKLAGREEEIKEYTIGTKALGRPPDFNPQLDAVVRIHASRLRTVLINYYNGPGKNAPVVISIPKGTYVPVFEPNNGNYQHNNNGHYQHSNNGKYPHSTNGNYQHNILPTEITLVEKPAALPKEVHTKPVIAVLSFHDLSPEQSNINFLTSFGEQLSTELARFDNLSVISFYATQKMDAVVDHLKELKNQGIDYVVTGSMRLFNGTMRLNIQLMTVENGNILWSDSFLRHQITNENAFDAQDEVISTIANIIADDPKMMTTLNKRRQSGKMSEGNLVLDAIEKYFDYTYDYNTTKFEATLQAVENAYKLASDHVLIVSVLSKLYLDLYACAPDHNKEILKKGVELANKAVALDPRSQFAQKALAWALILSGDKHKVEEAINHCVGINPTAASSLSTLGLGLIMMGDFEKGYNMLLKSVKLLDSPSACTKLGFSLYYYQTKNFEESSRWLDLLHPFDIPFARLLKVAVDGNLKGRAAVADEIISEVRGKEKDIVDRIALDPKLKTRIFDGWKRAGFVA